MLYAVPCVLSLPGRRSSTRQQYPLHPVQGRPTAQSGRCGQRQVHLDIQNRPGNSLKGKKAPASHWLDDGCCDRTLDFGPVSAPDLPLSMLVQATFGARHFLSGLKSQLSHRLRHAFSHPGQHAKRPHTSGARNLPSGNLGYGVSPGTLSMCHVSGKRSSPFSYIEVFVWFRFRCKISARTRIQQNQRNAVN